MNRFLVLFILLGSVFELRAQSCSPVDLRNTPGGRAMGPARNQGDLPWCVSYVYADLVSFRMRQRYSAVAMGMIANGHAENGFGQRLTNLWTGRSPVTEYHGSNFVNVFQRNRSALQCHEADLPSTDNGRFQMLARLRELAEIKRQYDETNTCSQQQLRTIQTFFPAASADSIMNILRRSYKADFHMNLYYANCARRNLRFPQVQMASGNSDDWPRLDQQLTNGNPVAINYGDAVLKTLSTTSRLGHASSIVARRMRAGKCEYLVRNSWGRSCSGYDRRLPCEEGHVWVPGDKLKEAIGAFIYLR